MRNWPYLPGVPAAGHVTASGFWHNGDGDTCHRCHPDPPCLRCRRPVPRHRRMHAFAPAAPGTLPRPVEGVTLCIECGGNGANTLTLEEWRRARTTR